MLCHDCHDNLATPSRQAIFFLTNRTQIQDHLYQDEISQFTINLSLRSPPLSQMEVVAYITGAYFAEREAGDIRREALDASAGCETRGREK